MLNVVTIFVISLYFVSKAISITKEDLTMVILVIMAFLLAVGFFFYCSTVVALPAINIIGFVVLTIFVFGAGVRAAKP